MYCSPNFKTKKQLKEAVAAGKVVTVFNPAPFPCQTEGQVSLEGPHAPEPHKWYARVNVKDGKVVSVK